MSEGPSTGAGIAGAGFNIAAGGTFCFCFFQAVTHPLAVFWIALTTLGFGLACILIFIMLVWLGDKQ